MARSPIGQNSNTWLIIDELAALGQVPSLATALSESRKFGGCIVAGIQNIHQLSAIYGQSQALNLLDQFSSRFIFRVGDIQTAQITSSMLGEVETIETQQSVSFGANTMRDGVNLNTLDKRRNLILPTEIMNLSNLTCFVKLAGNWPITKLTMQHNKTEIKNSILIKKELPQNQIIEQVTQQIQTPVAEQTSQLFNDESDPDTLKDQDLQTSEIKSDRG